MGLQRNEFFRKGSFYNVFAAAEKRAFNQGNGFIELFVGDFPRFKDEYLYRNKRIGIYKLAQLSVMALQSALNQRSDFSSFNDCDALTLCADYQLPRSLRAMGILEYGPELKTHVDQERLITPGSSLEVELRMAIVFAGDKLKKSLINGLLMKENPLSPLKSLITCFGAMDGSWILREPNII